MEYIVDLTWDNETAVPELLLLNEATSGAISLRFRSERREQVYA